jgi:ribose transport system permease protein
MNKLKLNLRNQAVWLMLVGVILLFSVFVPNFATANNFITILRQVANIGILSVGMTFVIIAGGIDLSIGNLMGLVGVLSALLMTKFGLHPVLACAAGIFAGFLIGLLNGLFITYTHMPALICTLGMSYVVRGVAFILTNGYPIYRLPESIKFLGQGYFLKIIPASVLIMAGIIVIGAIIMNQTHLGRQFYALGGNEEAARLAGINILHTRIVSYVICGLLAAVSGLVMMSRVNSGQALSGNGMEMDALIACVVGGVSVSGGEGRATGMIGGMLVMGVLANGLAVGGVSEYVQMIVKGGVLIIVVAVDCLSRYRKQ